MAYSLDILFQYFHEFTEAPAVFLREAVEGRGVDVEYADWCSILIYRHDDFGPAVCIAGDVAGEFCNIIDDEYVIAPEGEAAYTLAVLDPYTGGQALEGAENEFVGPFIIEVEADPVDIFEKYVEQA